MPRWSSAPSSVRENSPVSRAEGEPRRAQRAGIGGGAPEKRRLFWGGGLEQTPGKDLAALGKRVFPNAARGRSLGLLDHADRALGAVSGDLAAARLQMTRQPLEDHLGLLAAGG